jgi:hypothetical protein
METANILANLRQFIERIPTADRFSGSSSDLQSVGQVISSLKSYKDDFDLNFNLDFIQQRLHSPLGGQEAIAELIVITHSAINELVPLIPHGIQQVYGPGATYDFYLNFKQLLSSAQSTLLLVDPYLNEEVFDLYVSKIQAGVTIRILTNNARCAAALPTVVSKYKQQNGMILEVRSSQQLHDRVVFIDTSQCWVLGQSIKDAAKNKTTYLAPLPSEIVDDKLKFYEDIWLNSTVI